MIPSEELKIESGIVLRKGQDSPLHRMNPGDSYAIPLTEDTAAYRGALYRYATRYKMKVAFRRGEKTTRIWRTK